MPRLRALAAVALIATAVRAQPLELRTQGPLRELFLDVTGSDARPLARPDLDVRWTVANSWNAPMALSRGGQHATQELDEQADSLSLRVRAPWSFALGPRWSRVWSALELRATEHWGGWSDRPIEAWHGLIGAFNYERSIFPRNDIRLAYRDDGGTAFDLRSATFGLGDAVLRTQATLLDTPRLAVAARLDVKLPLGSLSHATGSGGLDVGTGLVATAPLARWVTLYGLLAISHFSNLSAPTLLQPKPWHLTAELSAEFALGAGTTFLVEDRALSPLLQPGWALVDQWGGDDAVLSSGLYADFRTHNQISFGLRRGRAALWLSEDFTPGYNGHSVMPWLWVSNAPDVVVGLSFTQPL